MICVIRIQKVTEEVVVKLAKAIAQETGERNLCLAGGVALNCVANGILGERKMTKMFDASGLLYSRGFGAALAAWYQDNLERSRPERL